MISLKKNLFYIFVVIFLTSCGGGDSQSPGNQTSGGLFVSQDKGSDINGVGSKDSPYKTISYALSKIDELKNIYISGGDYTTQNGETFPLYIKNGVNLIKSDENQKEVIIRGSGLDEETNNFVALILNGNNQLNSLNIDSINNIGIISKEGSNELLSCVITNNKVALGVINKSKIALLKTLISNNTHAGIEASGQSIINMVASKINNNSIGLIVSNDATLEFEHNQSSQSNEIMGNTNCDFFHEGHKNLQLREIKWDDDVFNFLIDTSCANGSNIVNIGLAKIDYQFIPSQNDTLFSVSRIINIVSPGFGNTVFSNTPNFIYNSSGNKHIMVVLWKTPPIVRDNIIINSKDIIWYWHTGMKNSPIGSVTFDKGSTPIDGDINPETNISNPPEPLERGRAYYFAVWEWDNDGIDITGSSNVSYFIVSP